MIPWMISHRSLPNGLRVVVEKVPGVRSVAVGVWVDVGSRDEIPVTFGASHFLEHLLFKGTDRWSAEAIARELDAVGGEFNAWTSKEQTVFHVRVLDDDLDLGLDILADITQRPALRPAEVDSERNVVLEEINMYEDSPDDLVHDIFGEVILHHHALGRPVLGTRDTITAMARDDVAAHFARWYGAGRTVIAVAGNIDPDAVIDRIGALWEDMAPAAGERTLAVPDLAGTTEVRPRDTEQTHLVLGAAAFPRDDPRRYALAAVNHVFGGGMSSRLFQEIRERRGLVYSTYSYRSLFEETGFVAAYAGCAPERAGETLDLLRDQWAAMAGGISAGELANAKGHLRAQMAMGEEDTASRMGRIGRSLLTYAEVATIDELIGRVDAVTLEDTSALCAEVFSRPTTLVVLGPDDTAGTEAVA